MGLKHYAAASSKNSKLSKHAACGEFLQYYSVVVGDKWLLMVFNMALLFRQPRIQIQPDTRIKVKE